MTLALTRPAYTRVLYHDRFLPLAEAETKARMPIEMAGHRGLVSLLRSFAVEASYIVEEQLALIALAEPRRRAQLESAAFSFYPSARRFFFAKFTHHITVSIALSHRLTAAVFWLEEALTRREMEIRMAITESSLNESAALFRKAYRFSDPKANQCPSSPNELRERGLNRLRELKVERQRGVFAAMLSELEFAHQAERTRIEWKEELSRAQVEEGRGSVQGVSRPPDFAH